MNDSTNSSEAKLLTELAPVAEPGYKRDVRKVVDVVPQLRNGRPKGSLGAATIFKQAVLNKQEDIMLKHLPKIVKLACKMAEGGDLQAMKMIMDRMVPVQKPVDGSAPGSGNKQINIIINGTNPVTVTETPPPIEAEFTREVEVDER